METQEQEYCGTCEMWTSLIKTWYRQRHKASSFSHRNGVYLVPCHVALCAVLFICFPFIIKSTFPIFNRLRQVDFVFWNLLFYHYHDISTPTLLSFINFFFFILFFSHGLGDLFIKQAEIPILEYKYLILALYFTSNTRTRFTAVFLFKLKKYI